MNILIADDDADSLTRLREMVEREGHRALCAEDGAEAWELYRNGDCRLVISAWSMPGMDGPDLVRRIRAEPNAGRAYVILLSGDERERVSAGMAAGADDFLAKPVSPAALLARL